MEIHVFVLFQGFCVWWLILMYLSSCCISVWWFYSESKWNGVKQSYLYLRSFSCLSLLESKFEDQWWKRGWGTPFKRVFLCSLWKSFCPCFCLYSGDAAFWTICPPSDIKLLQCLQWMLDCTKLIWIYLQPQAMTNWSILVSTSQNHDQDLLRNRFKGGTEDWKVLPFIEVERLPCNATLSFALISSAAFVSIHSLNWAVKTSSIFSFLLLSECQSTWWAGVPDGDIDKWWSSLSSSFWLD